MESRRKRFVGSGHSYEDVRFLEPYGERGPSGRGYSGQSLDRLRDVERQARAATRYPDNEKNSREYPVRGAPFRSQQQYSRGSSLPLDGRNPRQFESRGVPPDTRQAAFSNPGYSFPVRNSGQHGPREVPSDPRQQHSSSQGHPLDNVNPREYVAKRVVSNPLQQAPLRPAYLVSGRGPRELAAREGPPSSRQQTFLGPSQPFIETKQPPHRLRQQTSRDSGQYLNSRYPPRQFEARSPPYVYTQQLDERNERQFEAGRDHFNPQQQLPPHPRPDLNEFGSERYEPRQDPSGPRQKSFVRYSNYDRRFVHYDAGRYTVHKVDSDDLANAPQQNMGPSPVFNTERFTQDRTRIVHPPQLLSDGNPRPEPRADLRDSSTQITLFPHERHPNEGYNHSGNLVPGAVISFAHNNGEMEDISHMTTDFPICENGNSMTWTQDAIENPTVYADNNLNQQMPFRDDSHPMGQQNILPSAGEEVVGFQIPAGSQTIIGPDNVNHDLFATIHQIQRASTVDSNMEQLISQLPSRNNRIISIQGIIHHQQHQEQQRGKVSRHSGQPWVAVDDEDQGHTQPEEPEITTEGAQEKLQRLREEALPLAERRRRRTQLLTLIQEEVSSPTKEFVASITNVAHTSETVLSGAFDRINFVNLVKKTMEAEAGASVAAVFDLCSDLLRLNLFLAAVLISTIIIPSLVWTDDRQADNSRALVDCGNFSHLAQYRAFGDYDQIWGWITHEQDGVDHVVDTYSNDSSFICSGADLSTENLQVAVCSAYYVLQQECYADGRNSFTDFVLDFLQGKGFLERTSLFIGWYPAKLTDSADSYVIHLAYPLSIMLAYAVSIWFVARGFARWLKTQREILDFTHLYNNMIFRGWDCNIAKEKTATTEKKLLATEIQAAQWEEKFLNMKQNRTLREKRILLLTRTTIHLVVLVLIGAGWTAIYYVVVRTKGDSFWEEYAATMTIGAFNFVLPLIFFGLSRFEQYRSKDELLLFIIRNIFVRLISIMILAISEISSTIRSEEETTGCNADAALCWETKLAQQIYSLIVFDTLLYFPLAFVIVVRNWLRKVPSESFYIQWIPKPIWIFLSTPEFDTAGQVLRVVHVQTLCWMGLVCAPMIPLIASISFMIMILLNGATIFFCNLRPLTVFRASRSSSTFTGAILIGLVLSMIPSALVFTWLRPSLGCSPFRGLDFAYHALVYEICRTPTWIQSVLFYVDNFVVVGLVLLALLLALVYFVAKAQAAAAQIKTCEGRLKAVAKDKRRLMKDIKILSLH